MVTSTAETFKVSLACSECDERQSIVLNRGMFEELGREGRVSIFCPVCETSTQWTGVQSDRRSGFDRRTIPQARLKLPILVRCEHPAQQFTEATTTRTASCRGASFCTHHELRQGMNLSVILPFKEGDLNPIESRARVAWLNPKDNGWEVGIELLR